jgi:murein DD-endopeptidase MepM/ murein hydrolase activator NlpD
MRQRVRDSAPKAVLFVPGSPEENLHRYVTRVARFGANFWIRFRLPFLGSWVCTQGVDGQPTHQDLWRFAYDFEVEDRAGQRCRGSGQELRDFLCYRLPVLACADGTVAKVVDGIADNPVGQMNTVQNWGNLVLLAHGGGIFSLVCHLAPGTIKVREGEHVEGGQLLGLCGNSGRSPRPHLHFHLQPTARVGGATMASEFHEVIEEGRDDRIPPLAEPDSKLLLRTQLVPREGQRLRAVQRKEEVAAVLALPPGETLRFVVKTPRRTFRESVESDVDLFGNLRMVSRRHDATLYYETTGSGLTAYEYRGPTDSALFALVCAAPRVPFERVPALEWEDTAPTRRLLWAPRRMAGEFLSLLFPQREAVLRYRFAGAEGGRIAVRGEGTLRGEALETMAEWAGGGVPERIRLAVGGREWVVTRNEAPA